MQRDLEYSPCMPDISPISSPRRTHRPFRRKKVNVHEFADRDKRNRMANDRENELEFTRRFISESDARRYVPPREKIDQFFWAKSVITPEEEKKMKDNADWYVKKLHSKRLPPEKQYTARELKYNEIPNALYGPWTEHVAPKVTKRISRAFDKSDYYKYKSKPLTPVKSDVFAFRAFREYIDRNSERVPSVLKDETELKLDSMRKMSSGKPYQFNTRF